MNTPISSPSSPAPLTRRDFLAHAGAAAAVATLAPASLLGATAPTPSAPASTAPVSNKPYDIGLLEKWFFDGGNGGPLKYTPEQMAQTLDEIGLDLELTLRKDGHITPEKAPDELPAMAAALAKKNRRILWVALDTVRPDEPHWEKAIRAAKQLGVPQYRHRGFGYVQGKPIKEQIANFHSMAKDFAAANKEIGIQAVYQTHAGARAVGAAGWDLDLVLGDIDPKHFGIAFDTRHMMVELGQAWPSAIQFLAPRIVALCVKSFKWEGDAVVEVPLGEGRVKKTIVDQVIAAHGGPLPICIHIEHYRPSGRLAAVPFAERAPIVEAFRADARVLRQWLGLAPA
ncbi:MAG: TIM barrel protein [Opitutaceae bacterium]